MVSAVKVQLRGKTLELTFKMHCRKTNEQSAGNGILNLVGSFQDIQTEYVMCNFKHALCVSSFTFC